MPRMRYARRSELIETDLPEELILLDPTTQEMFSLNAVGRLVWRSLEDTSAEEIVERVVEGFEVERERAEADVRALLHQLVAAGLIAPVE